MDIRLTDSQIQPLLYRIALSVGQVGNLSILPAPTDDSGSYLAYSEAERDAILVTLAAAGLTATVTAEDQPDPTLLAACQGKFLSRSDALAAIQSGTPPVTLDDLAAQVADLNTTTASIDTRLTTAGIAPAIGVKTP
jgi:hypothetical protein